MNRWFQVMKIQFSLTGVLFQNSKTLHFDTGKENCILMNSWFQVMRMQFSLDRPAGKGLTGVLFQISKTLHELGY